MDRLHAATINILNLADRWPERLPLLLADFAALQPDVLAMQEVVYVMQQDRVIGAAGAGRDGPVSAGRLPLPSGLGRRCGWRRLASLATFLRCHAETAGWTTDGAGRPRGNRETLAFGLSGRSRGRRQRLRCRARFF